jgi:DNA anti-recombination protein RmuC
MTKDIANKINAELNILKKRLDGKDEGDDSTAEKLTSIQERLKAQNHKMDEVKAALTARDDELEAKVMEVDERLSKSVGETQR